MTKPVFYELEYYFRRSDPSQAAMLELVNKALTGAHITFSLQEWDLDATHRVPSDISDFPSLRRLSPRPEQVFTASFSSEDEVLSALGIEELEREPTPQ